jgi:hypothetical protein
MLAFQKIFSSYQAMIQYLSKIENIDKANFELNKEGLWVLNIVRFDNR